jgi:hypothetical protein
MGRLQSERITTSVCRWTHDLAHLSQRNAEISPFPKREDEIEWLYSMSSHVTRCDSERVISQPLGPTIAKMAPCGSRPWAIQLPPGTCKGPWMIWPPLSFTRAIAASTAATLK